MAPHSPAPCAAAQLLASAACPARVPPWQLDMHGMDSPGPAVIALKSTMGKQESSAMRTNASWLFATAGRTAALIKARFVCVSVYSSLMLHKNP